MRLSRSAIALAFPLLLAGCAPQGAANQSQPAIAPSGLQLIPLQVKTARATHTFQVEVAATEEQQARGLMFREQLGPDEGMIFPFPEPRLASFWMKNTIIPLDMIFIRADGRIARIAANTVPHNLEPEAVLEPVGAVLEIAGGRAAELGIAEGDRVSWTLP